MDWELSGETLMIFHHCTKSSPLMARENARHKSTLKYAQRYTQSLCQGLSHTAAEEMKAVKAAQEGPQLTIDVSQKIFTPEIKHLPKKGRCI